MAGMETREILTQPREVEMVKPDELVHFVERQRTAVELENVQTMALKFKVVLTGKWTTQPLDGDLRGIAGEEGAALRELARMYDLIWSKIWGNGSGHAVVEYDFSNGRLHVQLAQHTAQLQDGTVWTLTRGEYQAPVAVLLPVEKAINMNEVVRFLRLVGGKAWVQAQTDGVFVVERPAAPRLTTTCLCQAGPRPVQVQNEDGSSEVRMED